MYLANCNITVNRKSSAITDINVIKECDHVLSEAEADTIFLS